MAPVLSLVCPPDPSEHGSERASEANLILHASTVALGGRAVAITGKSGSGKSTLALELISRGCALIADDRTSLIRKADRLLVRRPATLPAVIEARGIGLLNVPMAKEAHLVLMVDMDHIETARLPEKRLKSLLGLSVREVHKTEGRHFPAAIFTYLMWEQER